MTRFKVTLYSSLFSILMAILLGFFAFLRTSVIINNYGNHINATLEVADQLLSYFVLLESGIGAAYLYKLFSSFTNKDINSTNELMSGYRYFLRKISLKMVYILFFSSLIFPFFVFNSNLSYTSLISIYLILGLKFIFPYFFTSHIKAAFIIHEKPNIIVIIESIKALLIVLTELLLIYFSEISIFLLLSVGFIYNIGVYFLYYFLYKLNFSEIRFDLKKIDESPNKMTSSILIHQISNMINSKIDILILSVVNFTLVTSYAAYNLIISLPIMLFNKVFDLIRPTFGLKFANHDKNVFTVFSNFLSVLFFLSSLVAVIFILLVNDFVTLWIGETYLFPLETIIMFSIIMFGKIIMLAFYVIRDSNGLYKESERFTIFATVFNFVLSILLVPFYGINGLLMATIFSNLFVSNRLNIRLVYTYVFKNQKNPFSSFIFSIIGVLLVVSFYNFSPLIRFNLSNLTFVSFLINFSYISIYSFIFTFLLHIFLNRTFRTLINTYLIKILVILR